MALPGKLALPYHMDGDMASSLSSSYRASSDSCPRMIFPSQVQEYSTRALGVGEAPMELGYTTFDQALQDYSCYTSHMQSKSDSQYKLSNTHMAFTDSMTGISPFTADGTLACSDGSSSHQSNSDYYQGQGTFGTPPSSKGELRGLLEDCSHAAVAGDASVDFQGLADPFAPQVGLQAKPSYPTATLGRHNSEVHNPAYTLESGKDSMSAEELWMLPRVVPSSPWSPIDRRMSDTAPGVEVILFAPKPGSVFMAYHDEQGIQDPELAPMDEDTQSTPPSPLVSANFVADWGRHHQRPEALFPPCHAQNLSDLQASNPADFASPMSITTTSTNKNKGGRPVGYRLSDEGAKNAREVREQGSCWHCFYAKKKCSSGTPCQKCQEISNRKGCRIFNLPCDRSKLQERTGVLLPPIIVSHLLKEAVKQFVRDNVLEFTNNYFKLVLSVGYGQPLRFHAVEFKPALNTELTHSLGVEIDTASGKSVRMWRQVPYVSLNFVTGHQVRRSLSVWLDDIMYDKLEGWTDFSCGKNSYSWLRGVLNAVCQFFTSWVQPVDKDGGIRTNWSLEQTTLRRALKLWILIWLMGHQLKIPEDQKSRIDRVLGTNLPLGQPVSPRLVNKLVKMMLRPMVERLVHDTLAGLHEFFRSTKAKGTPNWGCVFSTMILLLTVAAEIEISLDDIAACAEARGSFSWSRDDAATERRILEHLVPETIITFFYARFKSPKNYNPFQSQQEGKVAGMDWATQDLVRNISDAINGDGSSLFRSTELTDLEYDQLAVKNVPRLLSRFLKPYFEDNGSRNRLSSFSNVTDANDDTSIMTD